MLYKIIQKQKSIPLGKCYYVVCKIAKLILNPVVKFLMHLRLL